MSSTPTARARDRSPDGASSTESATARGARPARRGCRRRSRVDRASAAARRLSLSLAAGGDGGGVADGARGLRAHHRSVRLQSAAVRRPERAADRARAHSRYAFHFRVRNDRRGARDRGAASRRVGLHHQDEPEAARTGGESRDQRVRGPPGAARHRAAAARHRSHGPGLDLGARRAAALRLQQRFRRRDPRLFAAADPRHAAARSPARGGPCCGRAFHRRTQPGATLRVASRVPLAASRRPLSMAGAQRARIVRRWPR